MAELNNARQYKGHSIIEILNDYIVVDIETTGLDPYFDDIIEIGALKIKNGKIVDKFEQLIKPSSPVSDFISELTGITNDMLINCPTINYVLPKFIDFISDMSIVGHNVHFDINFLYDNIFLHLNNKFSNNFIDTLRLSRRLFPTLENHKLNTLSKHLNIKIDSSHRAIADCETTYKIYEEIKKYISNKNINLVELFLPKKSDKLLAKNIITKISEFDDTHLLYGKHCVFTGSLQIPRKEAMQIVVDFGGYCQDNVTKETNFLILGNKDYSSKEKSIKHKKAERYILEGFDVRIMSENVFMDLISKSHRHNDTPAKKTEKRQELSQEEFDKKINELIEVIDINFKENVDFEVNETLAFEYSNKATMTEKNGDIEEAIAYYEKSAYYGFLGNHVYDRLIMLYKKTSQHEKFNYILRFAIFVFYKLVNQARIDRLPKLKKYYDKYIKLWVAKIKINIQ